MTHPYRASSNLQPELRNELARLQKSLNDPLSEVVFEVLHEAPIRTRPGMVCYFDGTDFNPGSGEGLYRRNKGNTAWVFVG